jgi:hypothetical protein
MGLVGSLAAWSLGSCSMTVDSSSRIVRLTKRVSDLVTGRRARLILGGVVLFFFIELLEGEVIVVFLVILDWARVGMFVVCDEDRSSETVSCFLATVIY